MGTSYFSRPAILATSIFAFHFWAAAQGSLTPPGAPAATMKSLDQVEARTAITNTASLVTISQPGSYYLTHNLNVTAGDAIDINTNQVTLDLNGFTISSTSGAASGTAIYLAKPSGNIGVTILNGIIKSSTTNNNGVFNASGFMNGISHNLSGTPYNVRISGISVYGVASNAILAEANNASIVDSCTVYVAGNFGIAADRVSHCSALGCGTLGIFGTAISDCKAEEFKSDGWAIQAGMVNNSDGTCYGTNAEGIYARSANGCSGTSYGNGGIGLLLSAANNCTGYSYGTAGTGISAGVANNCYAYDGGTPGGTALDAQSAVNCYANSSSGTGIHANIANSCIIGSGTTNITHKYNMP
jgi:hypothetical protein